MVIFRMYVYTEIEENCHCMAKYYKDVEDRKCYN